LYCCIESYGFKATGTDANRGFGGLFLYHSAFYKVIYSLNLDLANKCVPQKNSTAPLAVHTSSFNTLLPLSMSVNDWNFLHLLFFRYFILLNTKRRLKNYPSYIIIEIKKELIGYKTSDCLSR